MNTFGKPILINKTYLYNSVMKKTLFITSCMIYFVSSIFINLFGQLTVNVMDVLNITRSRIALILTFEAITGLAASLFLGSYGEKFDKLRTVIVSTVILSIGTLSMIMVRGSNAYYFMFIFLMIANAGYIAIDLTMNSMIAELYRDRKNYLLPIIHIFYGIGAMSAPLFCLLCSKLFSDHLYAMTYFSLGIIALLLSFVLYLSSVRNETARTDVDLEDPLEIFRQKKTWHFLLVAIFYALFQTGMASWLSDYNISHMHMSASYSGMMISLYFGFALIMRLLSTMILRKLHTARYYLLSGIAASVCLFIALASDNVIIYTVFLLMTGFFSGGLVPAYMIVVTDSYPTRQSSSTSIFVFAVCISNLFAPVFGKIIESGTHDAAMYLIGTCLLVSAVLIGIDFERKDKHE